ncbi:MAG TPA: hypothetical protein PLP29_05155 [Candidatus Ozemobacteraceae bacterium]|nr:hypothetical protein [Candidatus Ozemobacteraceae bacterium]
MGIDVATFTKQLREDGIEAARREAEKILADAKAKAEHEKEQAKAAARRLVQEGEAEAARHRQKVEAELRLAARDLILDVKKRLENLTRGLLQPVVAEKLSAADVVEASIKELLKTQKTGREWEVALGPVVGAKLTQAAVSDLFKTADGRARLGETLKTAGFTLRDAASGEVVELTEASVSEAFGRLIAPELRALLDKAEQTGK